MTDHDADVGYWDNGRWVQGFKPDPKPAETLPTTIPITENAPVDPTENDTMLRELFAKVADKVVQASGLAAKVAELEARVAALQSEAGMWEQKHREEVSAHEATKAMLATVQRSLNDEQAYNRLQQDENDALRRGLNTAEGERDAANEEVRVAREALSAATSELEHTRTEVSTLREQVGKLNTKITKMIGALQE